MVSTKSGKTTTYHERALAAIVGLSQKKKLLHLNSVRTQVRKNASLRNDHLGPSANKWLSRGLQKLHDMGITEPVTSSHGSFTLSPGSRKKISEAQAQLGISWEPTPRDMEDISRMVLKSKTSPGSKRRASTSEDEAPAKRARTGTRSSSRLTKFQLAEKLKSREAEIETLRVELSSAKRSEQNVHPAIRGLSPLTPSGSDYGDEDDVNDALRGDDDEEDEAEHTQMDVDVPPSPTVVPTILLPVPSRPNITPLGPLVRTKSQSLRGLTATQSGSFIDKLSKQPTPAPSSPGGSDYEDPDDYLSMGMRDDVFNPPTPRLRSPSPSPQFEGGLATPEHTPPRPGQLQLQSQGSQEIVSTTELLKDLQKQRQENAEKTTTLNTQLQEAQAEVSLANANNLAKDALIITLQDQVDVLRSRQTRLQASEASLLLRQADLEAESAQLEAQLSDSIAKCTSLQTSLDEKNAEVLQLETENQSEQVELERLLGELAGLKTLFETRSAEYAVAQRELDQAKVTLEALEATRTQLAQVEAKNAELSQKLSASTADVAMKAQELSTAEQRIAQLQTELDSKLAEVELLQAEAQTTQVSWTETEKNHQSMIDSLRNELTTAQASAATLSTSLFASEAQNQVLKDHFISQTASHAEEIGRLQTQLNDQLTQHNASFSSLNENYDSLQAKYSELEKTKEEVLQALKEAEDEYDELVERKKDDERTIETQKKVIGEKTKMLADAVKDLEGFNERTRVSAAGMTTGNRVRRADRFSL